MGGGMKSAGSHWVGNNWSAMHSAVWLAFGMTRSVRLVQNCSGRTMCWSQQATAAPVPESLLFMGHDTVIAINLQHVWNANKTAAPEGVLMTGTRQGHRALHSTTEGDCCPPGIGEQGSLLPTRAPAFPCSLSASRFLCYGKEDKCQVPSVSEWMTSTNCASVGSSLSLGGFPLYKGPAGSRPATQSQARGVTWALTVVVVNSCPWSERTGRRKSLPVILPSAPSNSCPTKPEMCAPKLTPIMCTELRDAP